MQKGLPHEGRNLHRTTLYPTCLTWSLPPHSPAGTFAHRRLVPHYWPSRVFYAAGLTSRPHYDQHRFGCLTWIAWSATDIDFQPQHMSLVHYTGRNRPLSISELIAHADLPAFDIIVVVIDVDAAAAVFDMGIPIRRDIVADADFIGVDVIADATEAKPCQRSAKGSWPLRLPGSHRTWSCYTFRS